MYDEDHNEYYDDEEPDESWKAREQRESQEEKDHLSMSIRTTGGKQPLNVGDIVVTDLGHGIRADKPGYVE